MDRKQEVKETRQKARELGDGNIIIGSINLIKEQIIQEFKARPLRNTINFILSILLMMAIMYGISYVNNEVRYCTIHDGTGELTYNGTIRQGIQQWNIQVRSETRMLNPQNPDNNLIFTRQPSIFNCTYNPTRALEERGWS